MRWMISVAMVAMLGCGGGAYDEGGGGDQTGGGEGAATSSVTIVNDSNYTIYYLYVSPVSDNMWGQDQLGSEVIPANGGSFTLTDIPCDSYDVRLVDEDDDECIVQAVDICANAGWHITNEDLLRCEGYQ